MATNTQITTATNITGPNLSAASAMNNAPQYFNNFYSIPYNVSANANDAIVAFFEEYSQNVQTANSLAAAVLYTAFSQNLNPLSVLSEFKNLPKGQVNEYLAAFLNISRASTSMIGIKKGTTTSPFVSRTILM
ncbi:MAG TPA: hypothetical protein VFM18_19295 [Methanosarcina sp.]|nr:hypothetical protein [Methanosarcina sp.]